jgi:acyl dehydratase
MNFHDEPVFVGRDFGGRSVLISQEPIARYCEAMLVDPSLYAEQAPALLLHSECYENLDWYLKNIMGNLHARQEWELFSPLQTGETVTTRGFIRERYTKRNREYVVKETWVLGADGGLRNRGITHQSFPLPEAESGGGSGGGFAVEKTREKSAGRTFEIGGHGGRALEPLERTVTQEMCKAFSGPTPTYHTDREEARKMGFPDIVVQGMFAICFLSELLQREFGQGWLAGGKMDVRLVNVLWGGESVRVKAEVKEVVREGTSTRTHLDVWVEKTDGTKVIVGAASAVQ